MIKKIKSNISSQQANQQCIVCFENPPDSVIIDCYHGGVCYQCSLDIWKKSNECYLCRKKIKKIAKIDMSKNLGKYTEIIEIANICLKLITGGNIDLHEGHSIFIFIHSNRHWQWIN
ncbi:zinc finger domain protein [Ichthyophthirius multifiliis]|uniref:Zinc finger domain protein n=1 Tax=Ichthyophthirius multifiliis TaxID=5932 RepID=G0QW26_ICHMU|nr:zinc finger domain protein [Ichthyophthirius multifiliis]EGR30578.1 zinc finger domain protein [Ichthyophthirius multifiliis]|eukprot:XP_004032165.1 zinc finger domain protein [Ichthyophthirius multifiliis]